MSADMYFSATRTDGQKFDSTVYFFLSRKSKIGKCIMAYFAEFIMPEYSEQDTAREYPKYHITLDAWDRLLSVLSEKEDLIYYLADYVLSTFSFDEYVPEKFRNLESINLQKVVRFNQWFSQVFHCVGTFLGVNEVNFPSQEHCERAVADAYALMKWLQLDQEVRDFLLDDQYVVYIGIG